LWSLALLAGFIVLGVIFLFTLAWE